MDSQPSFSKRVEGERMRQLTVREEMAVLVKYREWLKPRFQIWVLETWNAGTISMKIVPFLKGR